MIESWIMDNTVNKACKQTICPSPQCGGLFNGWEYIYTLIIYIILILRYCLI